MKLSLLSLLTVAALALFAAAGCGGPAAPPPKAGETAHDHPSEGPHKGHLIELGDEEFHAELTHDDASKTVTIYLLGADAKTAAMSSDPEVALNLIVAGEPLQAKLAAAPLEGEAADKCSRYTLVDEKVLEALEDPKTTGRLNVNIAGKSYTGNVELGDHGHDHK
jgi:predicted small lipoprotein YifL